MGAIKTAKLNSAQTLELFKSYIFFFEKLFILQNWKHFERQIFIFLQYSSSILVIYIQQG